MPTFTGRELRRLRLAADMTLQKLSEASGVELGSINRIEKGRTKEPRHSTLVRLDDALGAGGALLAAAAGRPVSESSWPAKGESGVTQVTAASVTSRDRLAAQTSPTGEAEAKASDGEGRMGRWAWIDEELAALPLELQADARVAVHEAALKVFRRFQRDVARRGHRDVHVRAKLAR